MSYLSVFAVSILMMRSLTAFGVYYIRPSLYPAKFSEYPAKLPCPRWGGVRDASQVFRVPCQTSLAAAAALTFFCSFSCVKTRKGEEQGLCPFTPTFFSSLDGRKEGKRRSRRQGRRPSFPGTRPNFPAPVGDVRDAGQFFRVRYALTASDYPAFRP